MQPPRDPVRHVRRTWCDTPVGPSQALPPLDHDCHARRPSSCHPTSLTPGEESTALWGAHRCHCESYHAVIEATPRPSVRSSARANSAAREDEEIHPPLPSAAADLGFAQLRMGSERRRMWVGRWAGHNLWHVNTSRNFQVILFFLLIMRYKRTTESLWLALLLFCCTMLLRNSPFVDLRSFSIFPSVVFSRDNICLLSENRDKSRKF
jgi:hypothetical protein